MGQEKQKQNEKLLKVKTLSGQRLITVWETEQLTGSSTVVAIKSKCFSYERKSIPVCRSEWLFAKKYHRIISFRQLVRVHFDSVLWKAHTILSNHTVSHFLTCRMVIFIDERCSGGRLIKAIKHGSERSTFSGKLHGALLHALGHRFSDHIPVAWSQGKDGMKPVWRPTQWFVQEKVTSREKFTCDIHSMENTRVMCLLPYAMMAS